MTGLLRRLSIILTLSLAFSLAACADAEPDEPEVTEVPMLCITDQGTTDFYIIRSDYSNQDVTSYAVKLRRALNEKSGAEVGISTDWEKNPVYEHEIIVGKTLRESEGQFDRIELGKSGYIIKEENGRIFLIGGTDEGTSLAVDNFISEFVDSSDGSISVPVGYEYVVHHQYDIPGLYIEMKKLDASRTILIPENAGKKVSESAENLRQTIYDRTGLMLEIKRGSDANAAFVISDKKASADAVHEITVSDGKLIFTSSAKSGVSACVDIFVANYLKDKKGSINFPSDFRYFDLGDYIFVSYPVTE